MDLQKKLKELRKTYGYTQQEFSDKLGISRVNYTRYETGKVRPDYETIIKIADFYDISLDELFDRKKYL
ncbi:MAG: helix-turn-helix transcriptional regulator [Clostridia bacterium]|nr:helix-turn-helix transcriptional regulator [Clostridia bacterium]